MSLKPCIITHIDTKKVVSVNEALEIIRKDPKMWEMALEGLKNPFIANVRKSFQAALDKLGLKANVEFISDKEAEEIVKSGKPVKMMTAGFQTRDGKPIGFAYDTDQVARGRFDFSKLKKIGSGSDRDVYDLGDGKVLKVAKTARGLTQNIYEGDFYLKGIIPEVFERGLNYVVAENTPRIKTSDVVETFDADGNVIGKTTAGKMLSDLSAFSQKDFDNKTSKLQDVLTKYGLQDIMSYEVLWGDFTAPRNWGYKDGKAYHSDGGTFGGVDMIDSYKNKTNLSDPEFRKIYEESKRLKKQFGDTDKNTMYMREPVEPSGIPLTETDLLVAAKPKDILENLNRYSLEQMVQFLKQNDPNGAYQDFLDEDEFSREEGVKAARESIERMFEDYDPIDMQQRLKWMDLTYKKKSPFAPSKFAETNTSQEGGKVVPLFMKNAKGKVLGFVQPQPNGSYKVWIDPATTDAETPIHELAGHIFMPLLKEAAPELHAKGVELIQNTPYLKAAQELGLEGDAANEEALAQAIGEKGKQLSETKRPKFMEWLNGMWQKVGEKLGITKPIKDLTLGEFTDLIAGTVLEGSKLKGLKEQPKQAADKEALKQSIADNAAKLKLQLGDLFKSDTRLGIAKMPKQAAEELYEQHKALVETLKNLVSDISQIAKLSADDFADLLGQKATNLFRSAYNAFKTGKTSFNDFLKFNEIEIEGEGKESEGEPEFKKSKLAVRAIEGETSEEFKERLEELGYAYEVSNPKKAAKIAKELIQDFGWEVVLDKIRAGAIVGSPATKAFADIIDILGQKLIEAKTTAEFDAALAEQVALVKEFSLRNTQKGQEIQAIQDVLLNNDFNFSLAGMVEGYKAAGGVMTPEMMQKFKDLEQEIRDLNAKLLENENQRKELEEAAVLNAYTESQGRDDNRPQGIKDAAKAAANRVRKLKLARPDYINAASPAVVAWDTAIELVASSIEAGGNVAQAVEKGLKNLRESGWYKSVSKDIQDKVEADFITQNTDKATPEPEYIDNKVKVTKGAIAALVRQGYDTIDKVVDRVHEMLGQPDLSKRQIRDAITKYGQTINPTKDKIQQKVNELTRIGRKISQIEDARNKIRPLRSGLQRDKLVEQERQLQKELNQLLKELPQTDVDLSKAIKTATDAIKTRLQNQIEDLNTQIKKKERIPPSQKTPRFSIEELMLKDQRDVLQKTLDDLVGKPEISDEQKIQDAIEATEKSLAEYQRRINEMDFSSFGKPKGPESPELIKLREERDALKEQYELLKKGPPKSEEQKKLERLQKELEELRKNGIKDPKGKPIDSAAAKALKAQIEALKKTLGRDKSYETALKIAQKKLQDLEDKITNKKLEIAKKIQKELKGPELDAVRTQIKNTEKTLKQLREDAGIIAKAKLEAWKTKAKEATDKYNEKLRKGDFSTKTKEEIKLSELDEEGKRLLSEKIRAKEKYVKAVNEAKRRQEKATFGWMLTTAAGTLRIVLASGEFSFIMIQNKLLASGLLFRNPKALLDTFKSTFKAMASHSYSENLVENIKSQDWYPELKASGVTIIDDFTAESMKDETTHITTAQLLWNMLERPIRFLAFFDINPIIGKDDVAHEIYKNANPLEAFERAANAFGNEMRVIEFLRGREMLIKKGITFDDNPKAYKQLGEGINTLTNRTSLGSLETATPILNMFLFSARNWASVLKNLPPISFFYYGSKMEGADMKVITTPERIIKIKGKEIVLPSKTFSVYTSASPIQKMYLQDFMSFMALSMGTVGSFALYQALSTMGDDDEEKEKYKGPKVDFDLRSSGALKVQFGNQYLDVFGGYQQQAVLFTRIICDILIDQGYGLEGSYKSMTKGTMSRLGEKMYVPSKGDLMLNMVRNKLSPAAALGWDYAFSVLDTEEGTRELNGREIDLMENVSANLKPMYWQAVAETAEQQPLLTAAFLDGFGFLGASVNTLKEQTKTQAQQLEAKLNPNKEAKKAFNEALESGNIERAKKAFNKIAEKMPEDKKTLELLDRYKEITNQNPIQKHADEVASVVYGRMDDVPIIQGDTITTVRKLYTESELAFFKKKMDDFSRKQAKKVEILDSLQKDNFFKEYFTPYNQKFGGTLTEPPVVKKQPSLTERTMKNLKILFK
jgi:hypothetical protein